MEIKTSIEINQMLYNKEHPQYMSGDEHTYTKWIKVEDLIEKIKDMRIDFDESKEDTLMQGDWNNSLTVLKRELEKGDNNV